MILLRAHKSSSRSGLSILELLVSLALLALIAGGLAGSLNLGLRLFERSDSLSETTDPLAIRARLRGFLSQAIPPSKLMPFPIAFSGTDTEFEFTSLRSTPFAPDAAALQIQVTRIGKDLMARFSTLAHDGKKTDSFLEKLTTLNGNYRISYYSSNDPEAGWQPVWTNSARLPDLVRIIVDEGSRPEWPEFTVRLQLGP